jgi:hypothetical protein
MKRRHESGGRGAYSCAYSSPSKRRLEPPPSKPQPPARNPSTDDDLSVDDEALMSFIGITDADVEVAKNFLRMACNNVELAVEIFMEGRSRPGGGAAAAAATDSKGVVGYTEEGVPIRAADAQRQERLTEVSVHGMNGVLFFLFFSFFRALSSCTCVYGHFLMLEAATHPCL